MIAIREFVHHPTTSQKAWLIFISFLIGFLAGKYGQAWERGLLS